MTPDNRPKGSGFASPYTPFGGVSNPINNATQAAAPTSGYTPFQSVGNPITAATNAANKAFSASNQPTGKGDIDPSFYTGGGTGGGSPPQSGILSDPGYNEDWYKKYGESLMGSPSASESLYAEGAAGSNPFYDNAQKQTIKAINDAAAARGDFNSSYTMNNIGMAVADLRGQQAHELGQLAGQADAAKLGRFNASEGYSGDAQRSLENRVGGANNAYTNLANDQSRLVSDFYGEAGRESAQSSMAAIEAALKKAGIDMSEFNDAMKTLSGGGASVLKLAG